MVREENATSLLFLIKARVTSVSLGKNTLFLPALLARISSLPL